MQDHERRVPPQARTLGRCPAPGRAAERGAAGLRVQSGTRTEATDELLSLSGGNRVRLLWGRWRCVSDAAQGCAGRILRALSCSAVVGLAGTPRSVLVCCRYAPPPVAPARPRWSITRRVPRTSRSPSGAAAEYVGNITLGKVLVKKVGLLLEIQWMLISLTTIIFATATGFTCAHLMQGLTSLLYQEVHQRQRCQRIAPPPAEKAVEQQASQQRQ